MSQTFEQHMASKAATGGGPLTDEKTVSASAITGRPPPPKQQLVPRFAAKYSIEPAILLTTLRATCFKQRGNVVVSNEQMVALLVVADQYDLNPFTKEIFAFADKEGIIPVVSVDGWTRIINSHPRYDGIEFKYSTTFVTMKDGKPAPEWCEAVVYRTDRTRPTIIREYLDEVYAEKRNNYTGPWQTHTKRMLRHKTLIQGARAAFGFAGIYDEDEAHRILASEIRHDTTAAGTAGLDDFTKRLESAGMNPNAEADNIVDAEFNPDTDGTPVVERETITKQIDELLDPNPTIEDAKRMIENATTLEDLDMGGDLLKGFKEHPDHKELTRYYLNRRVELIDA